MVDPERLGLASASLGDWKLSGSRGPSSPSSGMLTRHPTRVYHSIPTAPDPTKCLTRLGRRRFTNKSVDLGIADPEEEAS